MTKAINSVVIGDGKARHNLDLLNFTKAGNSALITINSKITKEIFQKVINFFKLLGVFG